MSRSLNKVCLIGHVGQAPELRTAGGSRVASFSLATSTVWTDASGTRQERTAWHQCVAWNVGKQTLADIVERYVAKGERVYVEGSLEYDKYQGKDGIERTATKIRVRELLLLGGKREEPAAAPRPVLDAPRNSPLPPVLAQMEQDDDDGLPF